MGGAFTLCMRSLDRDVERAKRREPLGSAQTYSSQVTSRRRERGSNEEAPIFCTDKYVHIAKQERHFNTCIFKKWSQRVSQRRLEAKPDRGRAPVEIEPRKN